MPKKNKKVIGLFKDEYLGIPLREWVGLRSKMYAFRYDETETKFCKEMKKFITGMKEKKVYKGIKRSNIKKIKFDIYKNCLFDYKNTTETVYNITSKGLKLYTVKINKIALSPYDNKLYLVNNIETHPFGYSKMICDCTRPLS